MGVTKLIAISLGVIAMFLVLLTRRKMYPEVATWKVPVISLLLGVYGVLGTMLVYYIENGTFGGTSFFGAILLVPVLMLPTAILLHIPYGEAMDLSTPGGCILQAIMKVNCMLNGCCSGMYVHRWRMRFPLRATELIAAVLILVLLLYLERKPRLRNKIYPIYLIVYGVLRFCLNWLRSDTTPFVWILPPGNFWGLVAIWYGTVWLLVLHLIRKKSVII